MNVLLFLLRRISIPDETEIGARQDFNLIKQQTRSIFLQSCSRGGS